MYRPISYSRIRKTIVSLKRYRPNLNQFDKQCDMESHYSVEFENLVTIFSDINVIYQLLNGRIETILVSIKRKISEYLLHPIRHTKQNVRIMLNAQQKKDGILGELPREIVRLICEYVLQDLRELRMKLGYATNNESKEIE